MTSCSRHNTTASFCPQCVNERPSYEELMRIVRDLAASEPLFVDEDNLVWRCSSCGEDVSVFDGGRDGWINEEDAHARIEHADDCAWLRAKRAVEIK